MKKTLSFILAALLICSLLSVSIFAANRPGDIYTDGAVNTKDATRLAQYLAGWEITLTADEKKAADVKVDGAINSKDAVLIAQYLAGWNVTLGSGSSSGGEDTTPSGGAGNGDIEIGAGGLFGDN